MGVPTAKKVKAYLGDSYQESDNELIELYVETHQFYRKLRAEVTKQDLMYEYTNKAGATNMTKNPLITEQAKTVQTLNNLLKSLGLTPAQRKKVVTGDGEDDSFESF